MSEQRKQPLIQLAYDLLLGPERFNDLMERLKVMSDNDADNNEADIPASAIEEYEPHFVTAGALLEQQTALSKQSYFDEIAEDPQPAFLTDKQYVTLFVNDIAKDAFGIKPGQALSRSDFEIDTPNDDNSGFSVLKYTYTKDGKFIRMAMVPQQLPTGEDAIRFTAIEVIWNEKVGAEFAKKLGLSSVELDIVRALITSIPLRTLAEQRGRSLETLRTQSKNLLRKLELKSQTELVCLYSGYVRLATQQSTAAFQPETANLSAPLKGRFQAPNGLVVDYKIFGEKNTHPVVFFHGRVGGISFTPSMRRLIDELDLRVIAMWGPQFIQDTGPYNADKLIEDFLGCLFPFLDSMKVGSCPALTYTSGAIFAYAAMQAAPERFTGLVNVAGAIPLLEKPIIKEMKPGARVGLFLAQRLPKLLPVFLRSAVNNVKTDGGDNMLAQTYQDSPGDLRAVSAPDIREAVYDGFMETFGNGVSGHAKELRLHGSDWRRFIPETTPPITFFHGTEDFSYSTRGARQFAALFPNSIFIEIENGGQLCFYEHYETILPAVAAMTQPNDS